MIICQNVEKRYGGKVALSNFSYQFAPGHIYAILGPNGSGKSTLMKMIAGLVKPTAGQVMVDDHPLTVADKATIAYMPTEPYFFSYMTGNQAAKYYQDFFTDFSMDKFRWMISRMQVNPENKLSTYSTGMMAKFKVALNVARNPKMMMLDEPLNGIDMIAREEVTAGIVNGISRDAAILVSSHLIEDLERIADYVLFIKEGQLVLSGPTATFREQYGKSMTDMYREIYGAAILYSAPYATQPGQAPYAAQPGQAPYATQPQQAPYATQPGQASYATQPEQAPYATQPQQAPYATQPGQAPYAAQPGQAPYATQPGQAPYVAQPGQAPLGYVPVQGQPYGAAPSPAQTDGTASDRMPFPVPTLQQPYVIPAPAPGPDTTPVAPVQNPYRSEGASETPDDFNNPLA